MSDIVERLRQYVDLNDNRDYSYCDCADEAADEIKRLRRELLLLKSRCVIVGGKTTYYDADGKVIAECDTA